MRKQRPFIAFEDGKKGKLVDVLCDRYFNISVAEAFIN